MSSNVALRSIVEETIRTVFAGVCLGGGVSLRQAEVIDNYGEGVTDEEFEKIPLAEIVDNWIAVPFDELEKGYVAHLDAEGLRYYLPALMLSVINQYEPSSMRVIGTLHGLRPKKENLIYDISRYALLSFEQKQAVAYFLDSLPNLIELDTEDSTVVKRAIRDYWHDFLPNC